MAQHADPRVDPDANRWSDGPPLPRWALWLMLPGIVAPILIFAFIVATESAHDPAACPFRELSRRQLADQVSILEEVRSCVDDVEEHRFTLLRGTQARLLGERRFDRAAFVAGSYRWKAAITEQGEVQVVVHNQGHADLLLREGTAEERRKGISR